MLMLNEQGKSSFITMDEICLIIPTKNGPEFVTEQGKFRFPQTASQLNTQFERFGYLQVDRNAIVNLNKATYYDPEDRKIYLDAELSDGQKLWATVSAANASKLKYLIRESNETFAEYKAIAG
ncbi:LytTR family DNA-binding domain-containing protein [Paenibacillus baekrokdamisoli]|nr:LytTR family DNA-binding domain-containing protein [Paenibacillus baekrokdamisoli]